VSLLPSLTRRPRLGLKLTRASMEMPASADRSGEPQYLAEGSSHLSRDRFVCVRGLGRLGCLTTWCVSLTLPSSSTATSTIPLRLIARPWPSP
jgi:hypothetical protein